MAKISARSPWMRHSLSRAKDEAIASGSGEPLIIISRLIRLLRTSRILVAVSLRFISDVCPGARFYVILNSIRLASFDFLESFV